MTLKVIEYKINQAMTKDICDHLIDNKDSFYPPLDQRVEIKKYAQKIRKNADTFEAWNENRLIGLVAVYCNNYDKKAYVTSVSVIKDFNNMGVASRLLRMCIEHVEGLPIQETTLMVNVLSNKARKLYKKFDFQETGLKDDFIIMRRMK